MEFTDRFFGKGTPQPGGPPVANARLQNPPTFTLLFTEPLDLTADALTLALRDFHPTLAGATAELLAVPPSGDPNDDSPAFMGLIGWDRHVVKVVGFNAPLPPSELDRCVQPAHYAPEIKEQAAGHTAHVVLFYAGYERDPFEQFVALAAAAAGVTRFGALVVLNENARTSVPAIVLLPHEEDNGDTLSALRALPIPFIYAGFVKLEIEGDDALWMRTYGCPALNLPDFGFRAAGHEQGTATFNLFSNLLAYLRESGKGFAPGDTMNVGEGLFLRIRARTTDEWFLESDGEMLVVEPIREDEVNG